MTQFHVPENNAKTTVASPRAAGGGSVALVDGSAFGTTFPKIATVIRAGVILCILEITGRSGNTVAVSGAIEGTTDVDLQVGDRIELRPTKLAITEIHDAINSGVLLMVAKPDASVTGPAVYLSSDRGNAPCFKDGGGVIYTLDLVAVGGGGTSFALTGPSSGTVNRASSAFTLTPNGTVTGTVTLSAGGNGWTTSPTSLTWSGTSDAKTFVITPATVASQSVTPTGFGLPVSPSSIPYNAVAFSAKVSPSGKVLMLQFADNVSSVADGATLSVNGGTPIPLSNPMWSYNNGCNWVWYPLTPDYGRGLLTEDGGECVLTGTWPQVDSSNSMLGVTYKVATDDRFRQSSDPDAEAAYSRPGPAMTPFRVGAVIDGLVGPNRTTQAVYRVYDGVGLLSEFTLDQTQAQPFDSLVGGYHTTWVSPVLLPRDQERLVTVSNGAGAGVLVTDGVSFHLASPRVVPADATVAVSAPANTFTTVGGAVGEIVGLTATVESQSSWPDASVAFNPATPRTMEVGYNKGLPEWGEACPFYADWFRQSTGWMITSGSLTYDSHGELATLSGTAKAMLSGGGPGNGDDPRGIKTFPASGTLTVKLAYAGTGNPNIAFYDGTGSGGYSFGDLTWQANDPNTGKKVATCTYARREFDPAVGVTGGASPYYPQYAYALTLRFTNSGAATDVITGVEVYTGTPPAPSDPMANAELLYRVGGKGFASMRYLDCSAINAGNRCRFSQWTHPEDVSPYWRASAGPQIAGAAVTRIDPVDITVADADDALKWFDYSPVTGVVKVTTATPHGLLEPGQMATYTGPVLQFASTAGQDLFMNDFLCSLAVPKTSTTYLQQLRLYGSPWPGPGLLTIAAGQDLSGQGYTMKSVIEPAVALEHQLQVARECGVNPWVLVPYLFDDASVTQMAQVVLAGTTPGGVIDLEYGNEPWNTAFTGWLVMGQRAIHMNYLHSIDPTTYPFQFSGYLDWYAYRSWQVYELFKAVFVAAGRGSELRWAVSGQGGFAEGPAKVIMNFIHRYNIPAPHRLTFETYQDVNPSITRAFRGFPDFTAANAAFGRLDDEGIVDILEISALLGHRPAMLQANADMLVSTNSFTGQPFGTYFQGVELSSYEGGWAYLVSQDNTPYVAEPTSRLHGVYRHPRMFLLELKRLKQLQDNGCVLANRYTLDKTDTVGGLAVWHDYFSVDTRIGHGFAREGRNPYNLNTVLSQTGAAMQFWASNATVLPSEGPAASIALDGPTACPLGSPSADFTITPDGTITGVLTPHDGSDGTFNPPTVTLAGVIPKKFKYTPGSIGTKTITLTGTSVAVAPPSIALTVVGAPGPATSIAFSGPNSGTVGVPSTDFTLRPNGTTGDVLTPHDGSDGTFNPTTVTLGGVVPRRFKYTPGSAGAKTITLTGASATVAPSSLPYTANPGLTLTAHLHDTFVGTAGNVLTGSTPNLVQNGSDVWRDFLTLSLNELVFKTGGGATTTGTAPWLEGYDLTGVSVDQTVTVDFHFTAVGTSSFDLYLRHNLAGPFANVRAKSNLNQLWLGDQVTEAIDSSVVIWVANQTYRIVVVLSGTSATVSLDGVPTLAATVATPDGTRLILSQGTGIAGDVVIEMVKVEVLE